MHVCAVLRCVGRECCARFGDSGWPPWRRPSLGRWLRGWDDASPLEWHTVKLPAAWAPREPGHRVRRLDGVRLGLTLVAPLPHLCGDVCLCLCGCLEHTAELPEVAPELLLGACRVQRP